MNTNFLHATTLKTASIQQVNDALIVLRHFVELNYKLLPMLFELSSKEKPSSQDLKDIVKIRTVYDSYHFDVNASVILMNSPILELIREAYHSITETGVSDATAHLTRFRTEHAHLHANWNKIRNN